MSSNRRIYHSQKSTWIGLVIWGTIALMITLPITDPVIHFVGYVFIAAVVAFLLWIWFFTFYSIDGEFLKYRSGPLAGKIKITSIREIHINARKWSGFRPALSAKGMVIKYHRFDEIFISPTNIDAFVKALQEVHPNIEIQRP